ncbi:MAG: DNA polymerase I [Bacillota bacterium]|nr:DNA polymerase I [Bacillota bacterium]
MARKLVIIDGHSLANRAFYAIRELRTTSGKPTNAVYGFVNMLLRIIDDEKPDYMAVAFDKSGPTFRHKEFQGYKATRTGQPEDLSQQIPVIKEVVDAFRIPSYEIEGYEADDIIGTAAALAECKGINTVIVTGDRDMLQLVSDRTSVLLTKRGITEIARFDKSEMIKSLSITPEQVTDYKALVGDASDNIPGVPGVGDKTATRLISEYGSAEEVIRHAAQIPGRVGELVAKHAEQIAMSKRLATIVKDVPVELDLDDCRKQDPDRERLGELFNELEFRSLMARLGLSATPRTHGQGTLDLARGPGVVRPESTEQAVRAFRKLAADGSIALFGVCAGRMPSVLCASDEKQTLAIAFGAEGFSFEGFTQGVSHEMCDPGIIKAGHSLKPFIVALLRAGVRLKGYAFDSALAAYLLDPSRSSYKIDDLAREHANLAVAEGSEDGWQSRAVRLLQEPMEKRLEELGMLSLFQDVEMPLLGVLAGMEAEGVCVDADLVRDMGKEFSIKIDGLATAIYKSAGGEFNINSTKQLGEVLFKKLGLPAVKKTKTGYSTDADVLESLAPRHEIAALLLDYRQLVKLKGTYIDGLLDLVDQSTGKVHTTFNQMVTATGRLSSAEPNLQNIPIRQEAGRLIRKVFVPSRRDHLLLAADYSQIELRVLAHMSGDKNMQEAFLEGRDIHAHTASEVFGVPIESVNAEMRRAAKAVNFGIVYGISGFGLSRNLHIPRDQAEAYIQGYFARYPGVKQWIDATIEQARKDGYVTTMLGRRRYLPDLHSRNRPLRQFAERTAMNTPIQGTAADLIKLAMVRIDREIQRIASKAVMVLQVHDELIFEVPQNEILLAGLMIRQIMQDAISFDVPIVVDLKAGPNWCDMESM